MREHSHTFLAARELVLIVGPFVIVLIALRVRYLRRSGIRATGTAVSTRIERRTRPSADPDRTRDDVYYVHVTTVDYTDRNGSRHRCTVEGRHRPGSSVPLVYTPRRPHRAQAATAASYGRVFIAILTYAILLAGLTYIARQVDDQVDDFCAPLTPQARTFHDCP
ncbi:DUF3592 domain-containing protein [Embleya scabrispora]|uniref:DUF3592 domain-containing protein n=1 Tax=Embleya scabrispora TaxID=159449 RepID=UPI00037077E9|nr:DUF3592 domain-containing protein [Embleya scabrispora]MYS83503.1 hypothetical protein [Streptomyces sp. SID5474]